MLAITFPTSGPDRCMAEITQQFESFLPELQSRAAAIARQVARTALAQEEVEAEVLAHAWLNYRSAARRGKNLSAGQLAWVAWLAVRSRRPAAGGASSRDAFAGGRRRNRARILSISPWLHRRGRAFSSKPIDAVDGEMAHALTTPLSADPAEVARQRIDWSAFMAGESPRFQALLIDLAEGRSNLEVAQRLGVTPGRATQLRAKLGEAVAAYFQLDACGRDLP